MSAPTPRDPAPALLHMDAPLLQERYWCGCVREARWQRCAHHLNLDHDEEPQRPRPAVPASGAETLCGHIDHLGQTCVLAAHEGRHRYARECVSPDDRENDGEDRASQINVVTSDPSSPPGGSTASASRSSSRPIMAVASSSAGGESGLPHHTTPAMCAPPCPMPREAPWEHSSGFMCGKPLPCSDHSAAPPGAEAGTPDPLNQIAALLGLKLIPEESTIRPQSMSYVKPSELPGHVASLTSKREASA